MILVCSFVRRPNYHVTLAVQGKGVLMVDRLTQFFGQLEASIQRESFPVFEPVKQVQESLVVLFWFV